MPVTAKLSRAFYERFGDALANELVDWFNSVDATYRADLRELNELNFSRFDAKLEQRITGLDAKWDRRFTELDAKWDRRFTELDAKWEQRFTELDAKWEQRFSQLDASMDDRSATLDARFESLEGRMHGRFEALEGKLIGRFESRLAGVETRLLRWMVGGWASIMLVLLGSLFAALRVG